MLLSQKIALSSRSVLRLRGRDSRILLQGLVTPNVLERPTCYGYALDVRGRILFDFFFHTLEASENDYALDLDSEHTASSALKHLKQYRLRKKVELSLDPQLNVFVSSNPDESFLKDPRTEGTDIQVYRGLLSQPLNGPNCYQVQEYNELRLKLGWAEGRDEIPPGKCFPLEYNGDILCGDAVSFNKGCYIGQELTARTHHTGVIRKRIMPLVFGQQHNIDFDAPIMDSTGKRIGKLRSNISPSGRAIGLLRVSEVNESVEYECNGQKCKAEIPSWWPQIN